MNNKFGLTSPCPFNQKSFAVEFYLLIWTTSKIGIQNCLPGTPVQFECQRIKHDFWMSWIKTACRFIISNVLNCCRVRFRRKKHFKARLLTLKSYLCRIMKERHIASALRRNWSSKQVTSDVWDHIPGERLILTEPSRSFVRKVTIICLTLSMFQRKKLIHT